eukprot:symbB.v1.2.005641.t1/scaffold331.1/size227729/1
MGYHGEESLFVTTHIMNKAFEAEGLSLNFYRSYNTTHHNAKKYFGGISEIRSALLKPCGETILMNVGFMENYLKWTDDRDGMIRRNDGTVVAKCVHADGAVAEEGQGKWWLAPSCRHNISSCIPVLTSGNGWMGQAIMHFGTSSGIPLALGVIITATEWIQVVQNFEVLFYWWVPDVTFIHLRPAQLLLPRFSSLEWSKGNKRTQPEGTYVSKLSSANLRHKAPRVREFMYNVEFELANVMDMLVPVAHLDTAIDQLDLWEAAACRWISNPQNKEELWSKWIPSDINCFLGYGLVDSKGDFVARFTEAVHCEVCPSGSFSEEFSEGRIKRLRRCVKCAPGTSQAHRLSARCDICQPGTVAKGEGSLSCSLCEMATYQNASQMQICIPCGANRTTLFYGASSLEDCVCEAGFIEKDGVCVQCGLGLACPRGSTLKLLSGELHVTREIPEILPSYFSWPSDPLSIYFCPDESHCPGGVPGTCDGGGIGPTCSTCRKGEYRSRSSGCLSCGATGLLAWNLGPVIILIVIFASYYSIETRYYGRASLRECAKIGIDMMLAFIQNLGVLGSVPVPWPGTLRSIFQFSSIFLLDLQSLGYSCAVSSDLRRYLVSVYFFLGITFSIPALFKLTSCIPCLRRRGLAWEWNRSICLAGSFLQKLFPTMCNLAMVPFMCFRHPNGQRSMLKYPNTFCGNTAHAMMSIGGAAMIVLALTTFVMCFWGILHAPAWSMTSPKRLVCILASSGTLGVTAEIALIISSSSTSFFRACSAAGASAFCSALCLSFSAWALKARSSCSSFLRELEEDEDERERERLLLALTR